MTAVAEEPGEVQIAQVPGDLLMRIVRIALAVGVLEKRGYNSKQNYAFAKADDSIADIRVPMLEEKVLCLAYEHHMEERPRQTSGGGESYVTTIHLVFLLVAADTGERMELMWPGRGEDPMDKGVSKALTNAIKTFLRQQFLLPYGNDDPEADESTDERAGAANGSTVNLIADVKGEGRHLSDETLNEILVGAGLQPAQQPFRQFMRIPAEYAEIVKRLIVGAKRG